MGDPKIETKWLKKPIGIIYIIAWIFSVVILGLFYSNGTDYANFLNVTVASTFFLLFFLVGSFFLGEIKPEEFAICVLIFLILHGILNVCAGALMLSNDHSHGKFIATGVLCILLFILLFVNAFLVFQKR